MEESEEVKNAFFEGRKHEREYWVNKNLDVLRELSFVEKKINNVLDEIFEAKSCLFQNLKTDLLDLKLNKDERTTREKNR